jgi:6-phosphogluconolactonase
MPWGRTHFFWTDERLVPPDHPWSNFRLVDEILLSRVPKLEEHVHRIKGELGSATAAAMEYERELRCFFFWKGDKEKPKVRARTFDLVILGLGADGHIASLFPGDSALHISGRLAVAVGQGLGDPPVERVTLTIEAINAATRVWILVRGRGKVELARKILYEPQRDGPDYPAARIRPQGELLWLIGP